MKNRIIALIAVIVFGAVAPAFAAGTPIVDTGTVYYSSGNSLTFQGTVNPNDSPTTAWFEYGTTTALGSQTSAQSISGFYTITVTGVSSYVPTSATYYYRVVANNAFGTTYGQVRTYNTGGSGSGTCSNLTVTTNPVYNNTYNTYNNYTTSIALNGTINANGSAITYHFQYGTNYSLGQTTQSQYVSNTFSQVYANTTLYNLSANSTYYYRLVAQDQCGGLIYGQTLSFVTGYNNGNNGGNGNGYGYGTAPTVVTQQLTNFTNSSGNMTGTVNPNGSPTTAWFEYGTTASSLQQLTVRSVGSGYSDVPRSTLITSLRSGTTYYYRLVAQNSYGTSKGQVMAFTTSGVAPTPTPVPTPTPTPTPTPVTTSTQPTPNPAGAPVVIATPEFSSDSVKAGDKITYTLTLKNNGSATANNVSATITLPNEVTYVKSSPNATSQNGASYIFGLGTMQPGEEKKISMTLQAADSVQSEIVVQVSALIDYTDASSRRQTLNGSRTVKLTEKGQSAFANVGDAFSRVGNIPGYIWFFIFLLILIIAVTWIFFRKLRGTESSHGHDDHGANHDEDVDIGPHAHKSFDGSEHLN